MRRWVLVLACGCYHRIPDRPIDAAGVEPDGRPDAAASDAAADGQMPMIDAPPPPITRVQENHAFFDNAGSSLSLPFPVAQHLGNMNVLILGWINDHTLGTPTDDSGNTYQLAVYEKNNGMNQAVYYACDIAARTNNTVHVLFDSDLQVDMQILEYSGIAATSCLDQFNTNTGSSLSIDSGTVTTTQGHELVLGAGTILNNAAGSDPAFAYKVLYDFSIVETLEVFAKGTYRAKTTQSSTGDWVMQIVTFNGM